MKDELIHGKPGITWKNHKYTAKKIVNGKTVYFYGNEANIDDWFRKYKEKKRNSEKFSKGDYAI